MLRAIVIDDEQPAIDLLKILLASDGRTEVVAAFRRPSEALEQVGELAPDAIFLDVHMPGMSGLELAERLFERYPGLEADIVFVTGYGHYAIEAFRLNAINYLLKPADEGRVRQTVDRVLKRKLSAHSNVQSNLTGGKSAPTPQDEYTAVKGFGGFKIESRYSLPLKWRTAKCEELVAFLALYSDHPMSKWEIIEQLWPDLDADRALTMLHTTVYQARKAIKASKLHADLSFSSGKYRLSWSGDPADFKRFEAFFMNHSKVDDYNAQAFERMLAMYAGELYRDMDVLWCIDKRERLLLLYLDRSRQYCRYLLNKGNDEVTERKLRELLRRYPFDEGFHELMLGLLERRGDRAGFIQHYHRLSDILEREFGLQPGDGVKQLYQDVLNAGKASN
ncbi:response regulator [Cohnella hashimotonis]|uniref:Response regulator n=1 Tax=Cohnella hashimotonis TaxID=2826895 RepID=A0ABT6TTP1_9BACL|nr:response regulator [Cohnella hashimotonis]MDI4649660.1 response regulator [Cohnella hashimotonis]